MRSLAEDRANTYRRELELLVLGGTLASQAFAKTAFEKLDGADFGNLDIGAAFGELKEKGLAEAATYWLQHRGVKVNGKAIEAVLEEVRRAGLKRRLRFAVAGGDEELARKLLEELK